MPPKKAAKKQLKALPKKLKDKLETEIQEQKIQQQQNTQQEQDFDSEEIEEIKPENPTKKQDLHKQLDEDIDKIQDLDGTAQEIKQNPPSENKKQDISINSINNNNIDNSQTQINKKSQSQNKQPQIKIMDPDLKSQSQLNNKNNTNGNLNMDISYNQNFPQFRQMAEQEDFAPINTFQQQRKAKSRLGTNQTNQDSKESENNDIEILNSQRGSFLLNDVGSKTNKSSKNNNNTLKSLAKTNQLNILDPEQSNKNNMGQSQNRLSQVRENQSQNKLQTPQNHEKQKSTVPLLNSQNSPEEISKTSDLPSNKINAKQITDRNTQQQIFIDDINQQIIEEEDFENQQHHQDDQLIINEIKQEKEKYNYRVKFGLLQSLAMCCSIMTSSCIRLHHKMQKLGSKIDKKMENIKQKSRETINITSEYILLASFMLLVCIVYIILTNDSSTITEPKGFHDAKRYTANRLISGSLIFTFYGIFILQIQRYIYMYIIFVGQGMPSLFLFLSYCYDAYVSEEIDINNYKIIDTAFSFGIMLFWFSTWLIKEDLKKFTKKKLVTIFLMLWCILAGGILGGYTIYLTSTTFELNFEWGHKLIRVLAAPYLILISIIWVYMHFRYFQPLIERKKYEPSEEIKEGLLKYQEEEELLPIYTQNKVQNEGNILDLKLDEIKMKKLLSQKENQKDYNSPSNNNNVLVTFNQTPKNGTTPDMDQNLNSQDFPEGQQTNFENQGLESQDNNNQKQNNQNNQQQVQQKQEENDLSVQEQKLQDRKIFYQNILVSFTSMSLGGTMLFLTILSLLYVGHHLSMGELKNYENPQTFFMSVFMIICVPFTIILSTGVIFSKVNDKLKLILIPIFGAMIPLLFSVPLSLVIDYFVETRPLRRFFALGPAGVCLWMITLIYVQVDRWKISMLLNSYICLFFFVPFFYILPLKSNDAWLKEGEEQSTDDDIANYTFWGLIIAGVGLVFLVFSIQQIITVVKTWILHKNRKKPKTSDQNDMEVYQANEFVSNQRFELSNIFIYDLQYFGLWGNALGYILTFTILIYMYYYSPEYVSKSSSGILLGLQVTIIVLFFICLNILLMRIISEKKKDKVSFSEQISSMVESKHEKALLIDRQRKVRWSVVRVAILENTVFCVLMMIIFWDTEELRWTFLTMMIGVYIVGVIFCQLYITKRNFDDFAKTAVPALIVFSWIFLYLPFSGIVPVSIMLLSENDEKNVNLERLVFGSTFALILTGVLLVGLLAHLYFKRREFERKFKFIASKVIKKLAKNHVKSDYSSINLAFQGYVSKDREQALKYLVDGNLINFTEISKYNPDLRFSIMIIDSTTYEKLQNKGKKKKITFLQKFIDCMMKYYCCYRLCDKDKNNQILDEENANLLSDGENDGDDLDDAMVKANQANVKRMEDDDMIVDEDPWMKKLLLNQENFGIYGDIIEPLRRYDLSQNLQISKPFQSKFIKDIFQLFAQGSNRKFDMPWIDYVMFKQLIVLSNISPSREFPDYFIDKYYGKFTQYERQANLNPITEARFTAILQKIATIKYPYDPDEHALGKLVKNWLFPYLLWYIKPLHGLYPHEWDYVLFLLKFYGHKENHDMIIENDVNFRRDLEKYLGINQENANFKEDESKKEGLTCKRIQYLIKQWCISFCDNWLYFIKSHCLTDRDMWEPELDEVEIEVKMVNNTILKPVPFANKRKKAFKHEESPPWPKVIDIMLDEMKDAEKNYMKMKDEEFAHVKIRARISNYVLLVFKVIEIYTLGSLAFTPNIDWGLPEGILDLLNFFNTLAPSFSYGAYFVISVLVILFYLFINYRSVIRIRNGTFGNCESNRRHRNYASFDFLFVTLTNFISMVMGFFLIKIFFDAFSCDYSIKPQILYQDPSVICFEGSHNTYFGLAIICLLIYLPEITYLWPNIQYQNRAQDIRYDPTHYTIAQSAKVIIAAVSAFFAHQDDAVYFLGVSAFVLFMFGILTRKMKPCLVKIINPLEMGGYYFAGWMHISAIVCKYSSPTIGWITMGCGFLIILLISIGIWKILHDLQNDNKRRKKIKQTNEQGEEVEIEVDINSEDEEEEEERRRKKQKEESFEYKIWRKTKEFKDYKEDKDEWLDEKLIPYRDEEVIQEDEELVEGGVQENGQPPKREVSSGDIKSNDALSNKNDNDQNKLLDTKVVNVQNNGQQNKK